MAQDSFLGAFQGLPPWQLAHAAAASGAPLDALQVQLPPLMGGWDHDMVAMSGSLVSPPSPSPFAAATVGGAHEAALMEQLASRLGISVPSPPPASQYASCYGTPVGSPSKPVAAAASTTAARLPGFAAASAGKLSRVASSQSLLGAQQHLASSPGGVTPHTSDGSSSDGPSRKRKAPPAGGKSGSKAKEVAVTTAAAKSAEAERRAKKGKLSADDADEDDDPKPAAGQRSSGSKGKEVAVAEPPKDYIHVRARRGQATDSHSLAERVRREKISERMKLLQDIVPGCSKVTGKAVMLDEIINYVQSLQRQVEFLSMKLSTVNPRLEVDVDSFVQKDGNQSCVAAPTTSLPPPAVYSMDGSSSAFCYASSPPAVQCGSPNSKSFDTPSTSIVNHNHNIQDNDHSLKGFQNANNPHQIGSLWEEDDLQSLVQMGFRGGCDT